MMLRRISILMIVFAMLLGALSAASADEPEFVPNPHPHTVVVDWVDAMLMAIEANPPAPTATTWRMWVTLSSMYDAWAAYDARAAGTVTGYRLKRPPRERTTANKEAAVSQAAYRALTFAYPNQSALFTEVLDQLGHAPSDSTDLTTPEGVGNVAAAAVIAHRVNDGSNALGGFQQIPSERYPDPYQAKNSADPAAPNGIYGPDFDPLYWQPLRVSNGTMLDDRGYPTYDDDDPATYSTQGFLTPHWGAVEPFALDTAEQFRPQPPPVYGSDAPYTDAVGNVSTNSEAWVAQVGALVDISAGLTDERKVIAEMWSDGPQTWTPPGHWMQLAIGLSLRDGHTVDHDIRMFMALTGALLDAGISAWETKRYYDFIRPVSAIRWHYAGQMVEAWAGPGLGTRLIEGGTWQPYQPLTFVTPPFAEYTSGHSTFSRASREVLRAFTKSDRMYDGVTRLGRDYDGDGVEDRLGRHVAVPGALDFDDGPAATVVLRWDTLLEAADEAGISRRYGGIHFQDGDLFARRAGREIGLQVYRKATLIWNPFGESRQTVKRFRAAGDVQPAAATELTQRITDASADFSSGDVIGGCAALAEIAHRVDVLRGAGVSDTAHQTISGEIAIVTDTFCEE